MTPQETNIAIAQNLMGYEWYHREDSSWLFGPDAKTWFERTDLSKGRAPIEQERYVDASGAPDYVGDFHETQKVIAHLRTLGWYFEVSDELGIDVEYMALFKKGEQPTKQYPWFHVTNEINGFGATISAAACAAIVEIINRT